MIREIEKVFYRAFAFLMPSSATFSVARATTVQAARDLYGAGSAAERAVTQAWTAVGVNEEDMMRAESAFVMALALFVPNISSAQTQTGRVFISANGGFQATDNSFHDGATFIENSEQGQFGTDYEVKSGPALNIGGGA